MLTADTVGSMRNKLTRWSTRTGYDHLAAAKIMLVTIDAIDYRYCRQPVIDALGNDACRRAPPSLTAGGEALTGVLGAVDTWLNIYQTDGRWLRSGPISALEQLPAPSGNLRFAFGRRDIAHIEVAEQDATWSHVEARVREFMSAE